MQAKARASTAGEGAGAKAESARGKSALQVARYIWAKEGLAGFYSGTSRLLIGWSLSGG